MLFLQLLDEDRDNLINFREFSWGLGVMCRGELPERLRLLYRLHLPPALLPEDMESIAGDSQTGWLLYSANKAAEQHPLLCVCLKIMAHFALAAEQRILLSSFVA